LYLAEDFYRNDYPDEDPDSDNSHTLSGTVYFFLTSKQPNYNIADYDDVYPSNDEDDEIDAEDAEADKMIFGWHRR